MSELTKKAIEAIERALLHAVALARAVRRVVEDALQALCALIPSPSDLTRKLARTS